jgi:hypothetical protein
MIEMTSHVLDCSFEPLETRFGSVFIDARKLGTPHPTPPESLLFLFNENSIDTSTLFA